MSKLKLIFKGDVQGVFFRHFAKRFADQLNIKGYAKNLENGDVEIFLVGERGDLDEFIKRIKENPGYGSVDSIEKESSKDPFEPDRFETL